MSKGWFVHGATELPEIRDIVREELVEDEFIASKLLPEVFVTEPMAKIRVISAGQDKRVVDTSRAFNGSYKRVKWGMGSDFYETEVYGIEASWDNMEAMANETVQINERTESGLIATGILKTSREARVSEALFNTTTFTGADYYKDETAKKHSAMTLDEISEAYKAAQGKLFKRYGLRMHHLTQIAHPDYIDMLVKKIAKDNTIYATTNVALMTKEEQGEVVRKYFGLKEIVSTTAPYNNIPFSDDENTPNFEDIYPRQMMILGVLSQGSVGFKGPGLGWQAVFSKFTKDFEIEEYAEPGTDGQVIRAKEWRGTKVREDWGFLFDNVIV